MISNNMTYPKLQIHRESKGLIFDLDGTLADTMWMHVEAWNLSMQHYGLPADPERIYELAGIPTREIVLMYNKENGWSLDPDNFQEVKNGFYMGIKKKNGRIKAIPHVRALAESHRHKMPMSVGTGSIRSNALLALDEMEMSAWFEGMITAEDVLEPKPHPETFLKCAELLHLDPRQCQVFEDAPMGITAALSGGMRVTNIITGEMFEPQTN